MRARTRTLMGTTLAGLVLAAAGAQALADDTSASLGRLFSTPEERARIDEARRRARLPPSPVEEPLPEVAAELPPPEAERPPPPRGTLTLDGYVLRGDGLATVWVNGESSPGGPLLGAEASVSPPRRPGEGVYIEAADGARVVLRPGQSLAEGESVVRETWLMPDPGPGEAAERARGGDVRRDAAPGPTAPAGAAAAPPGRSPRR